MPLMVPEALLSEEGMVLLAALDSLLAQELAANPPIRQPARELATHLEALSLGLQPKQQVFSDTPADIAIFGGAAYGGKTYALLLEPLKHISVPGFGAVAFRRTYNRITEEGAMWDESQGLYRPLGGVPKKGELTWEFPTGAAVSFAHLQYEDDKHAWLGAQIALLLWDQLEEFSEGQFFYLLGRNRSTCGVRPYCRATCNPEPDSWLVRFLDWWIDDKGDAIPERSGVLRWMIRLPDDSLAWADSPDELKATYGEALCLGLQSVTFIPSTMDDNPIGTAADPTYESKLMVQAGYLRNRLRFGNWKARPSAGEFFKAHWFGVVDAVPPGSKYVRFWDLAATEPSPTSPDPDYTVGALEAMSPDGSFTLCDIQRDRVSPGAVERMILHTASQDGQAVEIGIEQEPGASGKITALDLAKKLARQGFIVRTHPKRIKTDLAAGPLASAAELGAVRILRGAWNKALLDELVNFPDAKHDDQVVACTGAHGVLTKTLKGERVGTAWTFAPVGA
jgi:predicted phage terminase large subunit-like protein